MDTQRQRPDHTLLQSIWRKGGEKGKRAKKKKRGWGREENKMLYVNSYFFLSFFFPLKLVNSLTKQWVLAVTKHWFMFIVVLHWHFMMSLSVPWLSPPPLWHTTDVSSHSHMILGMNWTHYGCFYFLRGNTNTIPTVLTLSISYLQNCKSNWFPAIWEHVKAHNNRTALEIATFILNNLMRFKKGVLQTQKDQNALLEAQSNTATETSNFF